MKGKACARCSRPLAGAEAILLLGVAALLAVSCGREPASPSGGQPGSPPATAGDGDSLAQRANELWQQGKALEAQGRVDEALGRYRKSIEIGPYDEAKRYRFGSLFVRRRPLAEVEAYYRTALPDDPKPQSSHYFWAVALARQQRFDEARSHLEQAIEIDPAHEMSFEALGDILVAQGRLEEAIAQFRQAITVHPEYRSAHERLAMLLGSQGRQEEADYHREQARKSDPATPKQFFYWGRALLRAGRVEAAIAELEKAVLALPEDAEAHALLSEARSLQVSSPGVNVILISVDTLRADHLNSYGYERRTTSPQIDALAADGILFENHIAASPWTLPAQMSLMTSLYPTAHGMTQSFGDLVSAAAAGGSFSRLAEEHLTLAEALRSRGYATGAFTGGGTVAPELGFDQGFDSYDTSMFKMSESKAAALHAWIRRHRERPFFLFWHSFEVHAPYLETDYLAQVLDAERVAALTESYRRLRQRLDRGAGIEERQRLIASGETLLEQHGALSKEVTEALYDACILSFDRHLGGLVELLRETGLYQRTMIVLTSDHGEEFGDHSPLVYDAHGHSQYDELIRIPLIIKLPGQEWAGTRTRAVTRSIDVMPTILTALGPSGGGGRMQGAPMQPLWQRPEGTPARIAFSEALAEGVEIKSVRTDRYKYMVLVGADVVAERGRSHLPDHPARRALFDIEHDPDEQDDLLAADPGPDVVRIAAALESRLRELAAMPSSTLGRADLADDTIERLRALGYLD